MRFSAPDSPLIRKTIQETNENSLMPLSIRLELLKDCPQNIPILVRWIYEEWHAFDASLTKNRLLESFKNRLNDSHIPFTLVALKNSQPIGMVSLKEKGEPEFADVFADSPWMGSLQIIPEERNQGLGQALMHVIVTIAGRLGHPRLLLYTANPKNVRWYVKRGARVIEQRHFRDNVITIMAIETISHL